MFECKMSTEFTTSENTKIHEKNLKKTTHLKISEVVKDELEQMKSEQMTEKDEADALDATNMEQVKAKSELIYVYDKERLLDLRPAPGSLQKPECLSEEFFNKDGFWDPEAWHKSNSSRSASPAVDGRTVTVEGKKMDLVDDDIQLAPHRGSFKQGCHVQADSDRSDRLGPRAVFDKRNRLTGRAAGQRRSLDNHFDKEEKHRYDRFSHKDVESKGYDRYEKNDFHRRRNDSFHKEKNIKSKAEQKYHSSKDQRHGDDEDENLPEWMTDGPVNNTFDFMGNNLEEERKAFTQKKKKVRISPDVDKQERKKQLLKENISQAEPDQKVPNKNEEEKGSSKFDINDFFNEVDYYPPHMFQEDSTTSDGVRSRFTQWFQAQQQRSRSSSFNSTGSRPGSTSLIPDEVISGVHKSPVGGAPYFTPIQPAPALVNAAASAHAVQTSNILNIIQKRKQSEEDIKANMEVKGRLSVKDIESGNSVVASEPAKSTEVNPVESNKNAFDMFLMSMKEAGQLPDKPAPVVTGLPDHLLPQPPKRTSPTFEKLKQTLNRSPSPTQLKNAVTTLAEVISTNPSLQNDLIGDQEVPVLGNVLKSPVSNPVPFHSSFFDQTYTNDNTKMQQETNRELLNITPTAVQEQKKPPLAAFTPTSVLKKLHNEKQRESPVPTVPGPDVSFIEPTKKNMFPDLLADTNSRNSLSADPITPDRSRMNNLPFHSAPTTPRNQLNLTVGAPPHSVSMPTTPDHSYSNDPPQIHRITSPLTSPNAARHSGSAFTPTKANNHTFIAPKPPTLGVIGSGAPQRSDFATFLSKFESSQSSADPRLAPGNGAIRNTSFGAEPGSTSNNSLGKAMHQSTPLPHHQQHQQHLHHQSQQQQLLHAQRMAQIQQAQLQQQQKLRQIANQANQQKLIQQKQQNGKPFQTNSGVGPLLPDPGDGSKTMLNGQQLRTPAEHRLQQQQQQRAQIQAFQQQQQHQVRNNFPNNNFRGGRPFQQPPASRNSPPIPVPMQQPNIPVNPLNRPQAALQNITAQALVQQQLLTRARFLAQAQLLQQQPQVFQAALMAQAALARGQAQAQAAMMLNPRNIQAMAEQMGIRPPHANNKSIPTPMVPPQNQQNNMRLPGANPMENDLSKWFTQDVLQKMPQSKNSSEGPSGKVMSVEELEQQS